MKIKPVAQNPLCRWSRRLRWPREPRFPGLFLGMEGCSCALNATNCIRSCLFFGAQPPTFLNASSLSDIASLERHHPNDSPTNNDEAVTAYFARMQDPSLPTVVLENFVDGAKSIEDFEFPPHCNLIAGHENRGVSESWIRRADHIVFVPQYGTISSMNVVSSAGIAMFYFHLSQKHREKRRPAISTVDDPYMSAFTKQLPTDCSGERADKRPIHPSLYHLDNESIAAQHQIRRLALLMGRPNQAHDAAEPPKDVFKLAVMYENEDDTRNLGGLIRNANSYLASVFYFGKRKINKQGSVGSDHYTPIVYLGRPIDDCSVRTVLEKEILRERRMELWELSLEQHMLFDDSDSVVSAHPTVVIDDDSLLLREVAAARQRSPGGIAIVVPQEGQPPGRGVRTLVARRLRLLSSDTGANSEEFHRGVPSQVGAAVALQRLFWALLATRA